MKLDPTAAVTVRIEQCKVPVEQFFGELMIGMVTKESRCCQYSFRGCTHRSNRYIGIDVCDKLDVMEKVDAFVDVHTNVNRGSLKHTSRQNQQGFEQHRHKSTCLGIDISSLREPRRIN